jgi:GT2 family glycosyltransferase
MLYPPVVASSGGSLSKPEFGEKILPLIKLDQEGLIQLRLSMQFSIADLKVLNPNYLFVHAGNDNIFRGNCAKELASTLIIDDIKAIGDDLYQRPHALEDGVTVIITTYNHGDIAIPCIESVLKSRAYNKTQFRILIADNASTDEELIEYLGNNKSIGVVSHSKNIGYIRSINNAIKLANGRDVITLNSDTIVHGNWVDRLREVAYYNDRIATVTPFSNNADAYSYPVFGYNELKPELVEVYDDIAKTVKCPEENTVPINHGFCSYYKRAALNEIGLFDDHAFDMGYGDELDWSFRASDRNWKHILACNVYVGHHGSVIFTPEEKSKYLQNCIDIMKVKWVKNTTVMMDWYHKSDPLLPVRALLDAARGEESRKTPKNEKPVGKDSVFVGFPHGGNCTPQFTLSLVGLVYHDARKRDVIRVIEGAGGLYVAQNRNNLVRSFIARGCEWLLQIDTDEEFDKEILYKLLDVADPIKRPIITGLYFGYEGNQVRNLRPLWYESVANEEFSLISTIPNNSLVKLSGCGTGCLLVHRSVFEKFPESEDEWKYFGHDIILVDGRYKRLGEDLSFCKRVRSLGFDIWGHSGAQLSHYKTRPETMETFIKSQR